MRRLQVALVCLALASCSKSPEEAAKAHAADLLRDPSSAQFRNVRVTGSHVCGEINGKNGFGAYSGFVRFHGDKDTAEIDPGDGGPTFNGQPVLKTAFESSYKIWCGA
ncbi:hypothetical protein [Caulobacter segnis]|uniref:hypothetical protein n=1 Tax=Caulobacter segnis TaxID=88688 RepID=UPI00267E969B|nr:hypothetical protein [Caulobacter segnis]